MSNGELVNEDTCSSPHIWKLWCFGETMLCSWGENNKPTAADRDADAHTHSPPTPLLFTVNVASAISHELKLSGMRPHCPCVGELALKKSQSGTWLKGSKGEKKKEEGNGRGRLTFSTGSHEGTLTFSEFPLMWSAQGWSTSFKSWIFGSFKLTHPVPALKTAAPQFHSLDACAVIQHYCLISHSVMHVHIEYVPMCMVMTCLLSMLLGGS